MSLNVKKIIYKVCTEILFHFSTIKRDSPLSYNRLKLETWDLRNLRLPQHCCSLVSKFEDLKPANQRNIT